MGMGVDVAGTCHCSGVYLRDYHGPLAIVAKERARGVGVLRAHYAVIDPVAPFA